MCVCVLRALFFGDVREICLEAHDVTEEKSTEVDFATINPEDLVRNGTEELVCEKTGICSVENVATVR